MSDFIPSIFIGWGLSMALLIIFTLPDPPPPPMRTFLSVSLAGIIGGLIGNAIFGSNPMPAHSLVGALSGASILTGAVLTFLRGPAR